MRAWCIYHNLLASAAVVSMLSAGLLSSGHGDEPATAQPAKAAPAKDQREATTLRVISRALNVAPEAAKETEPTTHKELTKVTIRGKESKGTLQTFCVGAEDQIYAVVSAPVVYGADVETKVKGGGEIHVLSADGKPVTQWTTTFTPQRIAADPTGNIYVGGSGRLAKYDKAGKLLMEVASPHVEAVLKDKETLREQAAEQLKEQKEQYKQQVEQFTETIKGFEDQLKELNAAEKKDEAKDKPAEKPEGNPADKPKDKPAETKAAKKPVRATIILGGVNQPGASQKQVLENQVRQYKQIIKSYETMVAQLDKKSVDDVINEITQRLQKIHAVTVSADNVYVTTAVTKGYGFAVWRTDMEFKNARQIITGLSGCCGQMDVQARGDELWVAENSRHSVVHYSKDGKKLGSFGSRERESSGASFGGCCNPMNVCFTSEGNILTSESEGKVKCFTPDGKYVGLVGSAAVSGGCKNVAIGSSKDGKYIYFYDLGGSQIIILAKQDDAKPAG
ncbi:MAG: hypothetical protein ACR2FY_06760 [Pirellulaceae bacterium]